MYSRSGLFASINYGKPPHMGTFLPFRIWLAVLSRIDDDDDDVEARNNSDLFCRVSKPRGRQCLRAHEIRNF